MTYCCICQKQTEFDTVVCDDEGCDLQSRVIPIDDYVTTTARKYPEVFRLLIGMATDAVRSDKEFLYDPIPPFPTTNDAAVKILQNENLSFQEISAGSETDVQLMDTIGMVKYAFLRFTLKTNKINVRKSDLITQKDCDVYKIPASSIPKVFEITHSTTFKDSGYLFHGSQRSNWYSIFMNGLKNFSGTSRMTNGSAHGKGIYLSDNVSLSKGYSQGNGKVIIGVFEVNGDKNRFKKTNQVYVVPDASQVRLKYIMVCKNKNWYAIEELLNSKFVDILPKITKMGRDMVSTVHSKRLITEIKNSQKINDADLGLKIEIDERNFNVWRCFITKVEDDTNLYKDMQTSGINEIELEVRFPQEYPLEPPFVRVVQPMFIFRTGHITLGGSICLELLTSQGWSPSYTTESLLIQIKSLVENDARIDFSKKGKVYSMREAQDAFERMRRSHGW